MVRTFCKSKITNAGITEKVAKYEGSIGIDKAILDAADIMHGEQVHVLNASNGQRIITYAIEEPENSGRIVLYGPAVRRGEVQDQLVILSFCLLETKESHNLEIRKIVLDENNRVKSK